MLFLKKRLCNFYLFIYFLLCVIKPPIRDAHFNFTFVTMLKIYKKAIFWRQNQEIILICLQFIQCP